MGIYRYTLRRLLQIAPVLLGVVTLTYLMMLALPGDPLRIYLGVDQQASLDPQVMEYYGFGDPWYVQFFDYISRLAQGDLGTSFRYRRSVSGVMYDRIAPTLTLMGLSYLVALPTAIALGIYGAAEHNEAGDHLTRVIGLSGISTPNFWLALMLIYLLAYHLQVLPPTGYVPLYEDPVESVKRLLMPVATLATAQLALLMRITRSSMIEELRADYVETARAYGLSERRVLTRYAFRNALLPLVTIIGLQLSFLLGGAVIVEEIFAIRGMGRLFFQSLLGHDYSVVVGIVLFFSTIFLLGVLVTDLVYAYIDPRIKYD